MKNKFLVLGMVVTLVAALVVPTAVAVASNEGEQQASTTFSTSLQIVAKDDSTAVPTIIFPAGAANADIENPYNSIDGSGVGNEQFYDSTSSLPVVRIKNTTGGSLTVTLQVTAWTDAVASERYLLVESSDNTVEATEVTAALTGTIATGVTIANSAIGHLYLEITLGSESGKSGTSDLTILGES